LDVQEVIDRELATVDRFIERLIQGELKVW